MIKNIININNIRGYFRNYCTTSSKFTEYDGTPVDLVYNILKPSGLKSNNNQKIKNIMLLHGLFGASNNWRSVASKIADNTNCNIIQVDQRNHGSSPHTKEFNYKIMSDDIERLIKKENFKDLAIIGHSLGGRVAMLFSLLHQDLVDKLIVIDISPSHITSHTVNEFTEFLKRMKQMNLNEITHRKDADKWLEPVIKNKGVRGFILTNLILGDNGKFHWRINIDDILNKIENVAQFPQPSELNKLSKNSNENTQYTKDTLFIVGGKSNFLVLNQDKSLMNHYFPNYQLKVAENSGHWVHADEPLLFIKYVCDFINHNNNYQNN